MHGSRSISPLGTAGDAGDSFVRSTAFEVLSRAGFVAWALVYAIIGLLALQVATGTGGKLTNQRAHCRKSRTSRSAKPCSPSSRSGLSLIHI